METIQLVIDAKLRKAIDKQAKHEKKNRSAWLRDAAREQLRKAHIRDLEEREIRGYELHPQTEEEIHLWEREIAWPEE